MSINQLSNRSKVPDSYISYMDQELAAYGVRTTGNWSNNNKAALVLAVRAVGEKVAEVLGGTSSSAFKAVFSHMTFTWGLEGASPEFSNVTGGGCTTGAHQINFVNRMGRDIILGARNLVVHELGHAFSNLWAASEDVQRPMYPEKCSPDWVLAWTQTLSPSEEFYNYFEVSFPNRPDFPDPLPNDNWFGERYGFASEQNVTSWQKSVSQAGSIGEEFADQFLGWVFNSWDDSTAGFMRSEWMNKYMPGWIMESAH